MSEASRISTLWLAYGCTSSHCMELPAGLWMFSTLLHTKTFVDLFLHQIHYLCLYLETAGVSITSKVTGSVAPVAHSP